MTISILTGDPYICPAKSAVAVTTTLQGVQGTIVSVGLQVTNDINNYDAQWSIFINQMYVMNDRNVFLELLNGYSNDVQCYTVVAVAASNEIKSKDVKSQLLINDVARRAIHTSQSQ
jgi:hypothetical protein